MAYTIPSNAHSVGDPNHTPEHDNSADVLGLLTRALAQAAGGGGTADPGGNAANITAVQSFISYRSQRGRQHE